jgi:membrane protein DedA with SNARE-associated domain
MMHDVAGELTWLILFGGIGYAFSNQWEAMSQFVSDFSGVLVGLALLGVGIFMAIRHQRKPKESSESILSSESQILNPEP